MNFDEIRITNPVTEKSLEDLIENIRFSKAEFIIIDFGDHDFFSLKVQKDLKEWFTREKYYLKKFKKIALLHPPGYNNSSEEPGSYNYFRDRQGAIKWFKEE